LVEIEGGARRIRNNPAAGDFIKGCAAASPCMSPIIRASVSRSLDQDRFPRLARVREAGWDEALGLVAARLLEIRAEHAPLP